MDEEIDSLVSREAARETHKTRDWTQGSIIKNLLSLSWPMVVSNSINVLGPTVDYIWLGKLGPDAMAAVGVSGMVVMLVNALLMGIFTGLRSMVSRYVGAKDKDGAIHVTQQAFVVAGILGVLLAIIGISLDRWILGLLGVSPTVLEMGASYMRINFIGMIAMALRFTCDGTMQASGDTVNPMRLAVGFRIVHVILSPVLIFGLWIFPEMGITGAATAGVVSQATGTLLGLVILMSGRSRLRLTFRNFHFDPGVIWRLIKIGIPASVMGLQSQFGQLMMTSFVISFGTAAVAAHALCQRIDMLLAMPLMGIGASAGVLVGQNLGARQPERAEKSGWIALLLTECILVILGSLILAWPEKVIHIFSTDVELGSIAVNYIRIAAISYMIMGFFMVLQTCVSGAGDTLPPMIIGLITVWLIQVPAGWFLSKTSLGVYGVRWAVVGGAALNMIVFLIYFKMGRWKRKRLY